MLVRFPLNRNIGRGNGVHCSVDHDAMEGRVGHVTHFNFFPPSKEYRSLGFSALSRYQKTHARYHEETSVLAPCILLLLSRKAPISQLPPPSVLRAIFNHIHKSPIIRITNLIHPILGVRPAGRARWVRSGHTFQRPRTTVAHARRQRPRVAGVGLAARECDVRVARDGEVLVAVVEALGEEAEAGAIVARVAVGEEGDVCASGVVIWWSVLRLRGCMLTLRRHVLRVWEWGDDGCLEGNDAEDVLLAGGGIGGEVDCL